MASFSVGKAVFGCQRLLRCLGTVLTAIERSDAERISYFDSMLVAPRRSRGHAAAFAPQQRGARLCRVPPHGDFSRVRARLQGGIGLSASIDEGVRIGASDSRATAPASAFRLESVGGRADTKVVAWLASWPASGATSGQQPQLHHQRYLRGACNAPVPSRARILTRRHAGCSGWNLTNGQSHEYTNIRVWSVGEI